MFLHASIPRSHGAEWEEEVCAYLDSHPEVTIIDHPKAVQALGNRATMLKLLDDDTWVLKVGGWC